MLLGIQIPSREGLVQRLLERVHILLISRASLCFTDKGGIYSTDNIAALIFRPPYLGSQTHRLRTIRLQANRTTLCVSTALKFQSCEWEQC